MRRRALQTVNHTLLEAVVQNPMSHHGRFNRKAGEFECAEQMGMNIEQFNGLY